MKPCTCLKRTESGGWEPAGEGDLHAAWCVNHPRMEERTILAELERALAGAWDDSNSSGGSDGKTIVEHYKYLLWKYGQL